MGDGVSGPHLLLGCLTLSKPFREFKYVSKSLMHIRCRHTAAEAENAWLGLVVTGPL